MASRGRCAEYDGGDGIAQAAAIGNGVEIEREEVGAFAGLERADVGPPEHDGAADRRDLAMASPPEP